MLIGVYLISMLGIFLVCLDLFMKLALIAIEIIKCIINIFIQICISLGQILYQCAIGIFYAGTYVAESVISLGEHKADNIDLEQLKIEHKQQEKIEQAKFKINNNILYELYRNYPLANQELFDKYIYCISINDMNTMNILAEQIRHSHFNNLKV